MTDIIDLALACYRRPLDYQDRFSLTAPLPEGIDRLLWLANGSPEVLEAAIRQTGAQPQELRDAARFCIQQWCLVRGADPYRVLGVTPDVPPEKIKEHYRLLMRLFHPDRAAGQKTWTDHYASRVTEAWTALSRLQDRAAPDSQSCPPYVPIQDAIRPVAERAAERPGSLANRYRPEQRLRARRRWAPHLLVWSGLMLVTITVLSGFYLERFSVSRVGFEPASAVDSSPFSNAAMVQAPVAAPADLGALGPLLAAPDWQALERREQQAQRQAAQLQEQRAQWEQTRRQQLVAEEALLESMREERTRLEQQVKTEQAKIEQVQAERLAAEQQRLTRLRAEQARVEQARTERELAEQRRLEALQAEQAKAERLAQELRAERQRLEKLKAEQAR
ncbi:MAG TPA: DnaJ domain-containing protein, partial [Candidatus Contendobacter sp.]|nr:DnaJ domain-containing protein [Candidatus Contendobacter sp.]